MKTTFTFDQVSQFFAANSELGTSKVSPIQEGHVSQAYVLETTNNHDLVARIAEKPDDFEADEFAYRAFGSQLPIPRVIKIDAFINGTYYCLSEKAPGIISNELTQQEINSSLPAIWSVFAQLFLMDISSTTGFGDVDTNSGNGQYGSVKEAAKNSISHTSAEEIIQAGVNFGLDSSITQQYLVQFYDNLEFVSKTRRLTHGDLGMDNMLMNNGQVSGLIDWAYVGYGDWVKDFAKIDFWWPQRFGDMNEFASQFGLETQNLSQRQAFFWAETALNSIWGAEKYQIKPVQEWFLEQGSSRLVTS